MTSLPAPFTRCPVCRGTTTMDARVTAGMRCVFSVCHTCGSRWDMYGNLVHRGQVVVLPKVDPVYLPCNHFEGCSSSRPHSNAGRPRGVKDRGPRKRKEEL